MHDGVERRKFKRVRANFVVIYRVNEPLGVRITINDKETGALMVDLGEGGVAIATEYDIPVKTKLLIKFTIVNTTADEDNQVRAMNISGEVRNNILTDDGKHRLGICFTHITKADRRGIADFVEIALKGS